MEKPKFWETTENIYLIFFPTLSCPLTFAIFCKDNAKVETIFLFFHLDIVRYYFRGDMTSLSEKSSIIYGRRRREYFMKVIKKEFNNRYWQQTHRKNNAKAIL